MDSEGMRTTEVEHKVHPRFEHRTIGKEWSHHDEAFYQARKTNFSQGAYWFWLFSEINNSESRKVCVLISRLGKGHELNGKKCKGRNYSNREFRGGSWCWIYDDRKVETVFHGTCEATIGENEIVSRLNDSSHVITGGGTFPYYTLQLKEDGGELGSFRVTGSPFSGDYTQNECLKMRSKQMISDDRRGFAKIDRVSQFPYCASNMADLFSQYEGRYGDWNMNGMVWIERARSFGMVANWKLLLVHFAKGSRLWFRRFTGTTLTYQEPMSFYFDHQTNGDWERFPFYVHDWTYLTDREGKGKHTSVYEDTRYLRLTGRGPKGTIEVLLPYNDAFLARYRSWGFEARYYQLAFDIDSLRLVADDGRVITEKELGKSVGYGEETFKRKWRHSIFEPKEEAERKYVKHDLLH